jgi:hypothetical protein
MEDMLQMTLATLYVAYLMEVDVIMVQFLEEEELEVLQEINL